MRLSATAMTAFPLPHTDNARRDFLEFTITSEMAWVVLDQYAVDRGDPLESPGKKSEMWILVKQDGRWLVACVSSLQPWAQVARCPVVQVDGRGTVKWLNPPARTRLDNHPDLMISAGRLRARTRPDDRALQSAVAWAAGALAGPLKRASLRQTSATGGALPVVSADGSDGASVICWVQPSDGMVLVTFDDTAQVDRRILGASVVFGLSPAQQRLARLLIDGKDLAAAAKVLSVSVNTARTQLRRIFEKTGVHNQSALVRLMLSIAPPLQ